MMGAEFHETWGALQHSAQTGADAYVMRHVIHDWEDGEATTILRNCRDAMNPEG